jgi:vacuolar-type H+-ATPase subunit H
MREVIRRVVETEGEAKRIVDAGKAEADRIRSEALTQAQETLARARREARVEAEHVVEAAVQEAGREKQRRLAAAVADIESRVRLDEAVRHRAVDAAVRCVCGQRSAERKD